MRMSVSVEKENRKTYSNEKLPKNDSILSGRYRMGRQSEYHILQIQLILRRYTPPIHQTSVIRSSSIQSSLSFEETLRHSPISSNLNLRRMSSKELYIPIFMIQ